MLMTHHNIFYFKCPIIINNNMKNKQTIFTQLIISNKGQKAKYTLICMFQRTLAT